MQGQLARKQDSEQRGRSLRFVACQLLRAQIPRSTTRVTCPQSSQPELRISAAEPQVEALTLAAKLDVSQVIGDPRVPVHFGNKVRGEGQTEKR